MGTGGNMFSVIIVGIAKGLFGKPVATDIPPGTDSPESLSHGNKNKYARLFITILLAASTNWEQAECLLMGKRLTTLQIFTVMQPLKGMNSKFTRWCGRFP